MEAIRSAWLSLIKAVLEVIEREKLQENAFRLETCLLAGLEKLKQKHMVIGDVRGKDETHTCQGGPATLELHAPQLAKGGYQALRLTLIKRNGRNYFSEADIERALVSRGYPAAAHS